MRWLTLCGPDEWNQELDRTRGPVFLIKFTEEEFNDVIYNHGFKH
jgi:hypothetical protein